MLDLRQREDLSYLQAAVDGAPHLSSRADMPDCLTDYWRQALSKLIAIAKEHADCGTVETGGDVPDA